MSVNEEMLGAERSLHMKIDMHCHVKEGSIDSRVSVDEYITLLKKKVFREW